MKQQTLHFFAIALLFFVGCKDKNAETIPVKEESIEQKYATHEASPGSKFDNGPLETREEMVDALAYLKVIDSTKDLSFYHVKRGGDGLSRPCPYNDNGSIRFLADTQNPPGTFYELPGPVMEHSSQDHFPYWVADAFFLGADQKLLLELSFLEAGPNGYYTDESYAKTKLSIWQYKDFGALIEMEGKLYLNEAHYRSLPEVNCPDYEP